MRQTVVILQAWRPAARALAALTLAACGDGEPSPVLAGSQPNDGDSIYLNVMPPGSNGNSAGALGLPGTDMQLVYPDHFRDALALYGDLAYAPPNLKSEPCNPPETVEAHQQVSELACNYFKHAGLEPDTVVSENTLTAANGKRVRIRRDGWGVPFIEGDDRAAALYGMGFAGAQDRLWLYDALRHLGRGRFSEFLGPAADTYAFDTDYAVLAGYDDGELAAMIDATIDKFGELGALLGDDLEQLVSGINAYVEYLQTPEGLGQAPPEYTSLALSPGGELFRFPPAPFTREDVVASATLIQSIFATGGGSEQSATLLLQELDPSFGAHSSAVPESACRLWRDVRHALDADTPYTIEEQYATQSPATVDETCPQPLPPGAAIWDPGSYRALTTFAPEASLVPLPLPTPTALTRALDVHRLLPSLLPVLGLLPLPTAGQLKRTHLGTRALQSGAPKRWPASLDPVRGARGALERAGIPIPLQLSNFIAINADRTGSGHPIGVMGPQTSYFLPQLLWEVAVVSNAGTPLDLEGRGVVFANLPYINIGRGIDFAFSATSGNSDQVDVRVSKLCNLDGSLASREDVDADGFPDADGYRVDLGDDQGMVCRALFRRVDEWVAQPSVASVGLGGPPGAETVRRYILRTHYGPVFATATVDGEAVALSRQRSTFLAELDTAVPFALATTRVIQSASDFQRVFNSVTGTFNWLYLDQHDVGYLHSGLFPIRAGGVHPELPSWGDGRYEWELDRSLLDQKFFEDFGSDRPFPARVRPLAVAGAALGVFEWPGHLAFEEHPQAINPPKGSIASWNNAPARGWWAADFNGSYGPVHRADLLEARLAAYQESGKPHDIASAVEIMSDAAFTDLRGQELLPLLLRLLESGPLTDEQGRVVSLMQDWVEAGSATWIHGRPGLGAYRRDRDDSGGYDMRSQVLLMDAWYPRLIERVLPELAAVEALVGQARYDAPGAKGSAFQEGWFQHLDRVLRMALLESATPYRALRCGDGSTAGCRTLVLAALDQALMDLGGFDQRESWTGSPLAPAGDEPVEEHDAVQHRSFSLLSVPPIHWTNRPTFQQVVEIRTERRTSP